MKKYNITALVILLWFIHLANIFIWTQLDVNYLTYDSHRHHLFSLRAFEEYRNFSPDIFIRCISCAERYPPLAGMVTAPFYFIFGLGQDSAVMINTAIFLALLLFSVYKIGEKFLGAKTGLLSAFIVSAYPIVFNQMKIYMLDLPLTAMVCLSIYFLLKSDNFQNTKYSVLSGIAIGLGMLVKANCALFIIGPFIYFWIKAYPLYKSAKTGTAKHWFKKPACNIALSLACAVVICAPYYLNMHYQAKDFFSFIFKNNMSFSGIAGYKGILKTWTTPVSGSFLINKIRAVLWYVWGFINWQLSFFFFAMFIIGLYFFLKNKIQNKGLFLVWIISSTLLVSYLIYGIGFNMEVSAVRFTMPMLPAAAVITAIGIMKIPFWKIRSLVVVVLIIFGSTQLIFVSYAINLGPFSGKLKAGIPVKFQEAVSKYRLFPDSIVLFDFTRWAVSGSDTGSHPKDMSKRISGTQEIFNAIDESRGNKKISVTIIPDDTALWHLRYMAAIKNKPIEFFCDWSRLRIDLLYQGMDVLNLISRSDYIIDKIGGFQGEEYVLSRVNEARSAFARKKDKFFLLKKIPWGDTQEIIIYKSRGKDKD